MDPLSGIMLAGGQSTRMGRPKALLRLGEKTFLQVALENLADDCSEILCLTDHPEWLDTIPGLRVPVTCLRDRIPNQGPLGGIQTGLLAAEFETVAVTACDLPFVPRGLFRFLAGILGNAAAAVPSVGRRVLPFPAVYRKYLNEPMEKMLQKGERRVMALFDDINIRVVPARDLTEAGFRVERLFFNVNTSEDLSVAQAWFTGENGDEQ